MTQETQNNGKPFLLKLRDFWAHIIAFLTLVSTLRDLILSILGGEQTLQMPRALSIAVFVVFLLTMGRVIFEAIARNKTVWLWTSVVILLIAVFGYGVQVGIWQVGIGQVGIWIEPHTPGCSDYSLHITSPLDGSKVQAGVIGVKGSLAGNPTTGSIVVIVRSPDGSLNWPSTTPVQTDPTSGVWRGAAVLGEEPLQSYRIAVALVGRSGRALIEYYNKVGRETGQWPAIEVLTDDIKICDQVLVVRE